MFLTKKRRLSPFAVDIGKHNPRLFQAVAIAACNSTVEVSASILALVAVHTAHAASAAFAARLLTGPSAAKFGFQLAKLEKFAARSTVSKRFAHKIQAA